MKVTFETALSFITHHSESVIQWVFLAIVLMAAFLIGRALFGKKAGMHATKAGTEAQGTDTSPASDIKVMLAKIAEQTAKIDGISVPATASVALGTSDAENQLVALRKDLAKREEELTQLKANSKTSSGGEADPQLSARVKELESKLAEYEILEEDIADLSHFKDENLRLREELAQLKGSPPPSANPPAPGAAVSQTVTEPAPAASAEGASLLEEFAQAVGEVPQISEPSEKAAVGVPETGDPMDDFENTVKLERQMQTAAPATTTSAEEPADDIFAEFASESNSESAPNVLDTDKVMSEISALTDEGVKDESNALEEAMDLEKMVMEAKFATKS